MKLIVRFSGAVLYRLPTDPDPMDETRGVSGYTFALAGEPDMDRTIRMHDYGGFALRSGSPANMGVFVTRAYRTDAQETPVDALVGAKVELLGEPKLENRNWLLTLPGKEPIVPFELEITSPTGLRLRRDDYFDPAQPDLPVWKATPAQLARRGASGIALDPLTIGEATGMWDPMQAIAERLALLVPEREGAEKRGDEIAVAALTRRIAELEFALKNPTDRRVMARQAIERFAFGMNGKAVIDDPHGALGGTLDPTQPWPIAYWMGGWDADTLTCFFDGALIVPYA